MGLPKGDWDVQVLARVWRFNQDKVPGAKERGSTHLFPGKSLSDFTQNSLELCKLDNLGHQLTISGWRRRLLIRNACHIETESGSGPAFQGYF
jgi:hypothetical protein